MGNDYIINNCPIHIKIEYGMNRLGFEKKDLPGLIESLKKSSIATLPVGYADGLYRILGNGRGKLKINNKFASIIVNICMDMTMVDVANIKGEEGDKVLIFGEGLSVSEMAKSAETISCEILTGILQRVKRIFYQD